jgi:DNA repair exonuclease SbcCD ATPase subunit
MDMEFVSFPHSPLCYYTRSTYNHKVKAQKLRRFFAQVNDKNAGQGTITFFLSVPIDYLANSEAFWTEMHSKNRQDLIQNLKQQLRALIEELQDFGEEFRDPEKLLQKLENWADIPGNNRRELIQDLKQQFLELRSQLRALAEQCIASEKLLLQQVEQPDVNKHPPKRFKVQHRDPV